MHCCSSRWLCIFGLSLLFSFLGKQICPNKRTWYMKLYMLYTYCMAYGILYCRGNPIRLQRTRITHQLQNENQNQTKSKYLFYWRLQVWCRRLELVNYGHNCRHPFAHSFSSSPSSLCYLFLSLYFRLSFKRSIKSKELRTFRLRNVVEDFHGLRKYCKYLYNPLVASWNRA